MKPLLRFKKFLKGKATFISHITLLLHIPGAYTDVKFTGESCGLNKATLKKKSRMN